MMWLARMETYLARPDVRDINPETVQKMVDEIKIAGMESAVMKCHYYDAAMLLLELDTGDDHPRWKSIRAQIEKWFPEDG